MPRGRGTASQVFQRNDGIEAAGTHGRDQRRGGRDEDEQQRDHAERQWISRADPVKESLKKARQQAAEMSPMLRPTTLHFNDCRTTMKATACGVAPIAIRTPISRVRDRTM